MVIRATFMLNSFILGFDILHDENKGEHFYLWETVKMNSNDQLDPKPSQ